MGPIPYTVGGALQHMLDAKHVFETAKVNDA